MKRIVLALALIFSINLLFSNPVDTVTAKIVASNFWKQNGVRTQDAVPIFKVEQMLFSHTSHRLMPPMPLPRLPLPARMWSVASAMPIRAFQKQYAVDC